MLRVVDRDGALDSQQVDIRGAVSQFAIPQDNFTHTFFASVKNRSASQPPSRPTPDCFTPPNGVRRSRSIQQFTQVMPAWRFAATRCARSSDLLHTTDARPYCVP